MLSHLLHSPSMALSLGGQVTSMVPLRDVDSCCIDPIEYKMLLLVPGGVCVCPSLWRRSNSMALGLHMSRSSGGWVPQLLATAGL